MTIIRPNSISGINSITAKNTDQMKLYDSNGSWSHVRAGVVTATSFVGPLTGNVTGNISGGTVAGSTGTFTSNVTIDGNLGVGGTITYEDVARVDATGISTFREGFHLGPLSGIGLTAYKDGSIRTSGIVTAGSYYGDGSNLSGIDASSLTFNSSVKVQANNSGAVVTGITTFEGTAIKLPRGTTAERPGVGSTSNFIRYNTSNTALEFYNGTNWVEIVSEYVPNGSTQFG